MRISYKSYSPRSLYVLSSWRKDQTTQSRIRLNLFSSKEYNITKLYLMRAFKKAKKFDLISGKELKSVVIRGRLDLNIISTRVERNYGVKTMYSLERTAVKRATNYCYLVSAGQFSKSFNKVPSGKMNLLSTYSAC